MIRLTLPLIAFAAAACQGTPPEVQTPVPPDTKCDAGPVQKYIGEKRSELIGAKALRHSHSALLRWIAPGQAVTMDFREDRLNLYTGPDERITRISCG